MKIKHFALAGVMALATTGAASAQSTIRIIGASTFRAPVHAAIESILQPGYALASSASSNTASGLGGAGAAEFSGVLISNSNAVVIKTYWTGSVAGVSDVASQRAITGFMADGLAVVGGTALGSSYAQESAHAADIAWSDATTGAGALALQLGNAAAKTSKSTIQGTTFTEAGSLGQTAQGIVPFEWVLARSSSGAPITGINQQNASTLIKQGYMPLTMVTSSTSDYNNYAFLVGRNEDSGSRLNVLAEAQTGIGQPVVQCRLTFTGTANTYSDNSQTIQSGGTNATLATIVKWPGSWPINTNTSISWTAQGHSGFIKGSQVADALDALDPVTGVTANFGPSTIGGIYIIGYVGTADGATAVTNGATALKYNGATYSQDNVKNGSYSLWGYEHSVYLSTLSGDKSQAANDIADTVFQTTASYNGSLVSSVGTDSAGIILDSSVLVSRGREGGVIQESY